MLEGFEICCVVDCIEKVICDCEFILVMFDFEFLCGFEEVFEGEIVIGIMMYGKVMLMYFLGGLIFYSYNQFYGVWKIVCKVDFKMNCCLCVVLCIEGVVVLFYSVIDVDVFDVDGVVGYFFLCKFGFDVFWESISVDEVDECLQSKMFLGCFLGVLLFDQLFVVGFGNYLCLEIFFCVGLCFEQCLCDLMCGECCKVVWEMFKLICCFYEMVGVMLLMLVLFVCKKGQWCECFWVFVWQGKVCCCCDDIIEKVVVGLC